MNQDNGSPGLSAYSHHALGSLYPIQGDTEALTTLKPFLKGGTLLALLGPNLVPFRTASPAKGEVS